MPLSEEENRLLEQMERALAAEDPKLASTMRGHGLERTARFRALLASLAFVAGLGMLLGGAMARLTLLGIIGFLVMLVAAVVGLTAVRGRRAPHEPRPEWAAHPSAGTSGFRVVQGGRQRRPRRQQQRRQRRRGTFMQRMEERWEHRRHEGF